MDGLYKMDIPKDMIEKTLREALMAGLSRSQSAEAVEIATHAAKEAFGTVFRVSTSSSMEQYPFVFWLAMMTLHHNIEAIIEQNAQANRERKAATGD